MACLLALGAVYAIARPWGFAVDGAVIRAGVLDTRVAAMNWVEENIPRGARVLIETFAPQLSSDDFHTLVEQEGRIVAWADVGRQPHPPGYFGQLARIGGPEASPEEVLAAIEAADPDYVIVSDFVDHYRAEAEHWPVELATMELILGSYALVKEFERRVPGRGPPLRILKRTQE